MDKIWFPGSKLADVYERYVEAGAGFIISPAIIPGDPLDEEKQGEWLKLMRKQYFGRWMKADGKTLVWAGHSLQHRLPYYDDWIEALKPRLPKDVPILAQALVYDFNPNEWAKHAVRLESMGVDMIEVNAGCPCDAMKCEAGIELPEEAKYGMMMGTEPDLLAPIIQAVAESVKVPVGFKMTGEANYPRFLAVTEKALAAGAKWVVASHMQLTVAPPDIWNGGKTKFPAIDGNPLGAVMGSALRMNSYKTVAMIAKTFPQIDVWGAGGVVEPEHVVESILLGAKASQCLTGIVVNGIQFISRVNNFLRSYMTKCGYQTIEDFRGLALQHVKDLNHCNFLDYVADTDLGKCTACGLCAETYCPCTTMVSGQPVVNIELCSGCGMCQALCPEDAKVFLPREEAQARR